MKQQYKLVGAFISAALLAACGGNNGLSSSPTSVAPSLAVSGTGLPQLLRSQSESGRSASRPVRKNGGTETVLYSFGGAPDGANPFGGLADHGGAFYGTTQLGGASGNGTVFKVTSSGAESVLYSFGGDPDGATPLFMRLRGVRNVLYGTTEHGGASGNGAVFTVTTSGTERVLYSFGGSPDGALPYDGLTDVNGTLYGTTYGGGAYGNGTVFKITASGAERVLYSFTGGSDGGNPVAGLTRVGSTLYGVTVQPQGGTLFQITGSGALTTLHYFNGGGNGANPWSRLVAIGSTLYGTTPLGGIGYGDIFRFTTSGSGSFSELYSFSGAPDGAYPFGGLKRVGSKLYGTTYGGGAGSCYSSGFSGCGTIFEFATSGSGSYSQLYSFGGAPDAANPFDGVTKVGGTLYGTTQNGGTSNNGTVFSLSGF